MPGILLSPNDEIQMPCIKAAREICRRTHNPFKIPESVVLPPIKHITAVGASYESSDGLSLAEEDLLCFSIESLLDLGVVVAEDFTLNILNLEWDIESDFLSPNLKTQTDLVLICNIFEPTHVLEGDQTQQGIFSLSPHHFQENSWQDAASRSGCNFIIVQRYIGSLSPQKFLGDNTEFSWMD
jgi:hypothetical protein